MANELTPEGEELFKNIGNDEYIENLLNKRQVSIPSTKKTISSKELLHIRKEVMMMLNHSQSMVVDTKLLIDKYTKEEEYWKANSAKIAEGIYSSFVVRLQRILAGHTAFVPIEIELVD